jgi:hypothetical protein
MNFDALKTNFVASCSEKVAGETHVFCHDRIATSLEVLST